MNVGDLVKLKGFKHTDPNEVPHGFIMAYMGLKKYKIKWLDPQLAARWALTSITAEEKLELIKD